MPYTPYPLRFNEPPCCCDPDAVAPSIDYSTDACGVNATWSFADVDSNVYYQLIRLTIDNSALIWSHRDELPPGILALWKHITPYAANWFTHTGFLARREWAPDRHIVSVTASEVRVDQWQTFFGGGAALPGWDCDSINSIIAAKYWTRRRFWRSAPKQMRLIKFPVTSTGFNFLLDLESQTIWDGYCVGARYSDPAGNYFEWQPVTPTMCGTGLSGQRPLAWFAQGDGISFKSFWWPGAGVGNYGSPDRPFRAINTATDPGTVSLQGNHLDYADAVAGTVVLNCDATPLLGTNNPRVMVRDWAGRLTF